MFAPIITSNYTRPDRSLPEREEQYHIDMARYSVGQGMDSRHSDWISMCWVIRQFWMGNQWIMTEDTQNFFKDVGGQSSRRIKVIKNFIKPIVEQYRGNAKIMDITPTAVCVSSQAINRREEQLQKMLFMSDVANKLSEPNFKNYLQSKLPIKDTLEETEQTFDNLFIDGFVDAMNYYLEYVGKENKFKQKQPELALNIALTGLGVKKYFIHNGDFRFKVVPSERYFWDRNAVEYDLSDSEFMGDYDYLLPSEIFERWQDMGEETRRIIQKSADLSIADGSGNGRLPVFSTVWRDYQKDTYGYVMDEFNYHYLTKINYIEEGAEKPLYTDKDLIPLSELNPTEKKILKKKNKTDLVCDIVRYCDFIPSEVLAGGKAATDPNSKVTDIVLAYGLLPYQDTEYEKVSSVQYPYKSYAWIYYDGVVDSPLSALINPQRMINRMSSAMEVIINNSKSANIFYDMDCIDPQVGGKTEFLNNIHQGKPAGMTVRRTGIHNAVWDYNPKLEAAQQYIALTQSYKQDMESIIGVNESLKGENVSANQLVGVTELQIQRASLIQEPFYFAMEQVDMQCYQAAANVGRRVFLDNERKVAIMVGDHNAKYLQLPDPTETYRVFIERTTSHDNQIALANAQLLTWKQLQMIDDVFYSKMYNRSTPVQLESAFRQYQKAKEEAQKNMAAQQQQDNAAQMGMIGQATAEQQKMEKEKLLMEQTNKQADRQTKLAGDLIKSNSKNVESV